ncbi:MAG TPA: 30S ribosomal protein S8, partial [Verrucomicrobiales bacterium]|nr:30S ribosomal protein S8 [Verrucomicrobiales bacterium]
REALEITPTNDKLRAHLAQTLLSAGQAEEAAALYKQVLRTSPQDNKSKLGLAKAFAASQQWGAAIVVLEELAKAEPDHEAMLLYSRTLLREGSFGKAMEVYQELLERWPDRPDAELDEHFRVTGMLNDEDDDEDLDYDGPPGDLRANDLIVRSDVTFNDVGGMAKVKEEIARILKEEGYLWSYQKVGNGVHAEIQAKPRYLGTASALKNLKRVSRPGLRRYVGCEEIPKVLGGMGIAIVSTSKGIMAGHTARKQNIGGELLALVW